MSLCGIKFLILNDCLNHIKYVHQRENINKGIDNLYDFTLNKDEHELRLPQQFIFNVCKCL